jgi:putative spermidine/putrescine transport system permease protein
VGGHQVAATAGQDNPARATRSRVARAERRRRLGAVILVAPLVLFIAFAFLAPIAEVLRRSVQDTELATAWPKTAAAVRGWNGRGLPDDAAFEALLADMHNSWEAGTIAVVARRLNYAIPGGRSLVMNSGRKLSRIAPSQRGPARAVLPALDPAWGEAATWIAVRRAGGPITDFFLLSALDLRRDAEGAVSWAAADERLYTTVLARTMLISAIVTGICLLLGFPVAFVIAGASNRVAAMLMILILLPFWTSLLARLAAWVVLLQQNGIVNDALLALGVIDQPLRLIFNRAGVIIAMVHILLPFMILPIYAVMKGIRPEYVRAARSLGATPATAFLRVYLPQTAPGIAAGVLLVFIMAVGYYITPALLGGADDQMISWFIAFYTTDTVNWGLAAALGVVLLLATGVLYAVYRRLAGAGGQTVV